ncbi:GNAT superfamily N-acetyltransferase [Sedimentibacter acidaminivorans]|uniref:GNAT superfamily N-acetyltransferase n=1 Tax=Sedimentibacter acidaminivorans TaxID=913099 RepID=A0ABS4GBR1_9FIRM|nr:GNAT superfamily N-acetyltransferase [Sedimentibacter acidaminivorans]
MNLRLCDEYDEQIWIKLNQEFMNYEIQDDDFWNNTQKNSVEVFRNTFMEALKNQDLIKLFLIEYENEIVGFANIMIVFSVWAHGKAIILDDLYIKEEYRGRGIGREVLKYIEIYAKENGYNRLQFQSELTNHDAFKFYTKIGYSHAKMNFYVKFL